MSPIFLHLPPSGPCGSAALTTRLLTIAFQGQIALRRAVTNDAPDFVKRDHSQLHPLIDGSNGNLIPVCNFLFRQEIGLLDGLGQALGIRGLVHTYTSIYRRTPACNAFLDAGSPTGGNRVSLSRKTVTDCRTFLGYLGVRACVTVCSDGCGEANQIFKALPDKFANDHKFTVGGVSESGAQGWFDSRP